MSYELISSWIFIIFMVNLWTMMLSRRFEIVAPLSLISLSMPDNTSRTPSISTDRPCTRSSHSWIFDEHSSRARALLFLTYLQGHSVNDWCYSWNATAYLSIFLFMSLSLSILRLISAELS